MPPIGRGVGARVQDLDERALGAVACLNADLQKGRVAVELAVRDEPAQHGPERRWPRIGRQMTIAIAGTALESG
jgi:hypothetical protein